MRDDDQLIEALKEYRRGPGAPSRMRIGGRPLSEREVQRAEVRLGFPLPSLLRRLYIEVGADVLDLLPLLAVDAMDEDESQVPYTVVGWYRFDRDNPPTEEDLADMTDDASDDILWEWPERLLMVADWGCNIYSCVDCSSPSLPVLMNDNNISWSTFAVQAPSLHAWLERGLGGEPLYHLDWDAAEKVRFPDSHRR